MSAEHPAAYVPSICAGTEFDADCDCDCPKGVKTVDCGWPDCGCGCLPDCKACAMAQEEAASRV